MKCSSFYSVLVIVLLIVSSSYAQKDIVVFTGVNERNAFSNQKEIGFVDYYHNIAINLGVGANFTVVDFLLISPTVEINIFAFPKDSPPCACISEPPYPKLDISQSVNYRFLLELKIISSDKYTRQAYLLTGFGYTIEDVSDIEIVTGNYTEKVKYDNENYFIHTFGVGVIFSLNDNYAINIEGKFLTNYKKFDNSLNVGFIFKEIDLGKILF